MLSAYPAISSVEFDKAGKALLRAYAVSHKVAEWTDLKQTKQGIFIQQKRTAPQIVQSAETITYADEGCEAVEMVEQEDKESLCRRSSEPSQHFFMDFSIVLSQTYQVPVLWFSSASLSPTSMNALDQVYENIVSPALRTGLREIGVLGGISIAEHPVSGLPAFFVHPCRTQEALEVVRPKKRVSPIEYMMLWFGIIGLPVGLSIPSETMQSIATLECSDRGHVAQVSNADGAL